MASEIKPDHEKAREREVDHTAAHKRARFMVHEVDVTWDAINLARAYLAQAAELEEIKRVLIEEEKANMALFLHKCGHRMTLCEHERAFNKAGAERARLSRRLAEEGAKK